jgi:hypothetical protein
MKQRSVRRLVKTRVILLALLSAILGGLGTACGHRYEGKIVAVLLPDEPGGTLEGSGLIAFDADAPEKGVKKLTGSFSGAAAPSLSHDGHYLFFQGKKNPSDPWQIWVLDLWKGSFSQVTDLSGNCTGPVSLPDETVIFSREDQVKGIPVNDLWRCGMDGCCPTRITFNPAKNLHPGILLEGRILYLSSQQYPVSKSAVLMVMRPDGTKSEMYSPGCCEWHPASGGTESADGYVYFITNGGQLARVMHHRPLHTFEILSEGLAGEFSAISPLPEGNCLVSYKPEPAQPFGIYQFDPVSKTPPTLLYQGEGNLTDPLRIAALEVRPRKLPSAVNMDNPTGQLMSQDINHSMLAAHTGLKGDTVAMSIRVTYLEGGNKVIETGQDGSFYLTLDAEKPFRIETLNNLGETVRGPSDWIYLRPNERRACTGCHADPELAPENIQPIAVKSDPVVFHATQKESEP